MVGISLIYSKRLWSIGIRGIGNSTHQLIDEYELRTPLKRLLPYSYDSWKIDDEVVLTFSCDCKLIVSF